MSEIGDGLGSSYPGSIDSNTSLEVDSASAGKTKARANVPNDLGACIVAIQTELGTDPAGSASTLKARLTIEHLDSGYHDDTKIVNVSGIQTITGTKTFTNQVGANGGISVGLSGILGLGTGYISARTTVGASGAMWFMDDVRTSGSMRGTRNPTHPLEYANKQYVDNKIYSGSGISALLGSWTSKSFGVDYQATTDLLIVAYAVDTLAAVSLQGDTDGSNPPTTTRAKSSALLANVNSNISITFPVRKGDYWKVTKTNGTTSALFEIAVGA